MTICAYCKQDKKATREHLIPKWFLEIDRSPDDISFLERRPRKISNDEPVIKDVCYECNNVKLSDLDQYGKSLYNSFFGDYVYHEESPSFKYDYDKLLKWLLKCTYNSARVHNTDLEVLKNYAELIIKEQCLPKDIMLFCSLISPSVVDDEQNMSVATRSNHDTFDPFWFRNGVFRVKNFDSINWCFRTVFINSYCFFLFVPKIGSEFFQEKERLLSTIEALNSFGKELTRNGNILLSPPVMHAYESLSAHMEHNPLTYENENEELKLITSLMQDDDNILCFIISREEIETGSMDKVLPFFGHITGSREVALLHMQKIDFSIDGYKDDPRELYEIDDVICYILKLNKTFPYWIFFQHNGGSWLKFLLACLVRDSESKTLNIIKQELLTKVIKDWINGLNELCYNCAIGETLNRKISNDFNQFLKSL